MRITTYKIKKNVNTKRTELIKEKAVNYHAMTCICSPEDITRAMEMMVGTSELAEEYVYMLAFNSNMDLLGLFEVSHGTVKECLVSPREIFNRALLIGASAIVLVHNHPSGNITPSKEDINVTKTVKKAGELLGIQLLDHIIIGGFDFTSLASTDYWIS